MIKGKINLILFMIFIINILSISTVLAGGNIDSLHSVIAAESNSSTVKVTLNYNLKITPDVKEVPVKGLLFSETRIKDIKAIYEGQELQVTLAEKTPPNFQGVISLPAGQVLPENIALVLDYEVLNALNYKDKGFVMEAPLVIVNWKPLRSGPGVFTSETTIPGRVAIEEQFPTTPREIQFSSNRTSIKIGLQTLPSLVRLAGREGNAVFLTYGRKVDILVIVILIIGAYFGYQAIKKGKKE